MRILAMHFLCLLHDGSSEAVVSDKVRPTHHTQLPVADQKQAITANCRTLVICIGWRVVDLVVFVKLV